MTSDSTDDTVPTADENASIADYREAVRRALTACREKLRALLS